jgi:hypothetical protein
MHQPPASGPVNVATANTSALPLLGTARNDPRCDPNINRPKKVMESMGRGARPTVKSVARDPEPNSKNSTSDTPLQTKTPTHYCSGCLKETVQGASVVEDPVVLATSLCTAPGTDGRHTWTPSSMPAAAVAAGECDWVDLFRSMILLLYLRTSKILGSRAR